MWDRMPQHCHSSTPPAHMHGMLEPCVQHLPLHHTITTPPQHLHIRSHHKHTYQLHTSIRLHYTTLQSHHNQNQITSITRVVHIRINQTRTRTNQVFTPLFATNLTNDKGAEKLWLHSLSTNQQKQKNMPITD